MVSLTLKDNLVYINLRRPISIIRTPDIYNGQLNLQDWNLQDWKMTDEVAGVEFAGRSHHLFRHIRKPHATHKPYGSVFIEAELWPI